MRELSERTLIRSGAFSDRPQVILPDSAELELKIPLDARSSMWVCFDGAQRSGLRAPLLPGLDCR